MPLRGAIVALAVLALGACATPVIMLKNDATGVTVTCGGNTIGSLEGRSTEQASDEACVRDYEARGYRRTNAAQEKLLQQSRVPRAAPVTRTTVPVESRWLLAAESLAKQNGCAAPLVTLTSKGEGVEQLQAACTGGGTLPITCTVDGCRTAR